MDVGRIFAILEGKKKHKAGVENPVYMKLDFIKPDFANKVFA